MTTTRSSPFLALPAPPPELMDDAVAEILFCLPPDNPACLVRASLVCKLWNGILSDPTFPDRYREFHRTPPLLGILSDSPTDEYDESAGRFVPMTTSIPICQPEFKYRALDCHHGRVLLDMVDVPAWIGRESLAVWDPLTGDHEVLSNPKLATDRFGQSGVVLCAAAGCNHRGCHGGGPFQVVFVSTTSSSSYILGSSNAAKAWVYSSDTAAWSKPVSVQIQYDDHVSIQRIRAAIVGDQIYFLLSLGAGILKYDLGKGCLTVISSPCMYKYTAPLMLMAMEDGSLGFAGIMNDFTTLYLWATKVNQNGYMEWVQDRVILLNNLPVPNIGTVDTCGKVIDVIGVVEGVGILLLSIQDGRGFMFDLKSERFTELSKPVEYYRGAFLPYFSFYIPDFGNK